MSNHGAPHGHLLSTFYHVPCTLTFHRVPYTLKVPASTIATLQSQLGHHHTKKYFDTVASTLTSTPEQNMNPFGMANSSPVSAQQQAQRATDEPFRFLDLPRGKHAVLKRISVRHC